MGTVLVLLLAAAADDYRRAIVTQVESPAEIEAVINQALGGPALGVTDSGSRRPAEVQRARTDAILAAIGKSPKACALRRLNLIYLAVTAKGIAALAKPCIALEVLDLSFNHFDDETAAAIAAAPFARSLRVLWIGSNNLTPVGLASLSKGLPMLEELDIGQNQVGPAGAAALASAPWAHLRILKMGANPNYKDVPIGPDGALALAAGAFPALAELDLHGNVIGPAGLRALIEQGLAARLRKIGLTWNNIDRAAAAELGAKAPNAVADIEPEVMGAWSMARASRLRQGDVIPMDLTVSSDADARIMAGVVEIHGSLTITGDVRDLKPLSRLTTVTGDLKVWRTQALSGLNGLGALSAVKGDVLFEKNLKIRSTAGLSSLREVGGSIIIPTHKSGNPGLREVALPSLERVGGQLGISREEGYIFPAVKNTESVQIKTIRPFRRLVSVGDRCCLVEEEPRLFPALPPDPDLPQ